MTGARQPRVGIDPGRDTAHGHLVRLPPPAGISL